MQKKKKVEKKKVKRGIRNLKEIILIRKEKWKEKNIKQCWYR